MPVPVACTCTQDSANVGFDIIRVQVSPTLDLREFLNRLWVLWVALCYKFHFRNFCYTIISKGTVFLIVKCYTGCPAKNLNSCVSYKNILHYKHGSATSSSICLTARGLKKTLISCKLINEMWPNMGQIFIIKGSVTVGKIVTWT